TVPDSEGFSREVARIVTGYSPARLSATLGTVMVSGTVVRLPGFSCGGCAGPRTHASGTPSALSTKWSTVRPALSIVALATAGCPGVRVRESRSTDTRIRRELPPGRGDAPGCTMSWEDTGIVGRGPLSVRITTWASPTGAGGAGVEVSLGPST